MPFRWNLTLHALEQMTAMGVEREDVVDCIENPLARYPSERQADCMVARNQRLTVPYNPTTGDVITVLWTSTDWLPDRYLPPEEQAVSGWINLDAKASEKVLSDWGFVVKEDKGQTKLWFHPADPDQRLIPFATPGSRRGNGKGSWRTAASALGMSVNDLIKGPTPEQKVLIGALQGVSTLVKDEPDPLGIKGTVGKQILDQAEVTLRELDVRRARLDALTPLQRSAYDAVEHEPLTANEIALLIERGKTVTNEVMNHLVAEGLVVSRTSTPEDNLGTGRPRLIYLAGDETTQIPPLNRPDPEPLPDSPTPVVEAPTPEEAPVPDLAAVPKPPDRGDQAWAALTGTRVFEETPIVWPSGGIVIKDDAGNLYVARPLVEQGK